MTSTQSETTGVSQRVAARLQSPASRSLVPSESRTPPRQTPPVGRSGLCPLCVHTVGCTFPVLAGRPVLECLEFVGETTTDTAVSRTKPAFAARRATEASTRPLGLCLNCATSESCTFPKQEAGVWQCEEYA